MPELVHWLFTHPVRWVVPAVLLVSCAAVPVALWWERRHPSSYPAQQEALESAGVDSMDGWHGLSTEEQEAADTASLDLVEQAELDAEDDARDAAQFLAQRVQVNALYHP